VEFPSGRDQPKRCHRAVPIGSGINDFVLVRMQHESIMLSFLSLSLVRFMPPTRSAPKEGENLTVICDCGQVTAIVYMQLATILRSLELILPIHLFTITQVHVCKSIPIITIRMSSKTNAGVRALTR
jgi:hypothetical protein